MENSQRINPSEFLYHPPRKLMRLLEWLQNATLSHQPAQMFYAENWLQAIQLDEMQMLLQRCPTAIKRFDIVPLAREANETETPSAHPKAFPGDHALGLWHSRVWPLAHGAHHLQYRTT